MSPAPQRIGNSGIVERIANMKVLDLMHELNPSLLTTEIREKVLLNQAARATLLAHGGAEADVNNKGLSTEDLTKKIADKLQAGTPQDRVAAATKEIAAERNKMEATDYAPDKRAPPAGALLSAMTPADQQPQMKNLQQQAYRLQADARLFHIANAPDAARPEWPEARGKDLTPTQILFNKNRTTHYADKVVDANDKPTTRRALRDIVRQDARGLLQTPDINHQGAVAQFGREIGANDGRPSNLKRQHAEAEVLPKPDPAKSPPPAPQAKGNTPKPKEEKRLPAVAP